MSEKMSYFKCQVTDYCNKPTNGQRQTKKVGFSFARLPQCKLH